MKQLKSLTLILPFVLLSGVLSAQKKTITGKVTDKTGNYVLLGVNVLADKQKGGSATKADGTYSITVDKKSTVLIFSYVGYVSQTVIIGDRTVIDVALEPANATSEEVVVIGYGSQKRSDVTGAVSKYQNEKMDETPSSRLDQALQGKIAGVQIQNISSEAGSEPKVQVRGLTSITLGASPLVVVDGHPSLRHALGERLGAAAVPLALRVIHGAARSIATRLRSARRRRLGSCRSASRRTPR